MLPPDAILEWHLPPMQRSGQAASYSGGPEVVQLGFAAPVLAICFV